MNTKVDLEDSSSSSSSEQSLLDRAAVLARQAEALVLPMASSCAELDKSRPSAAVSERSHSRRAR